MRFRFRDCVVDGDLFELRRAGERVALEPKVLQLLLFLLQNRERAVGKDEILDAVWAGTAVGEGSLTRAISLARDALGDERGDASIVTVRGRGYRIGVPVVVEATEARSLDEPAPRTGFLCREKELALGRDALLQAISGRGQLLLLAGEPGIGKTRLADELAALASARGAHVCFVLMVCRKYLDRHAENGTAEILDRHARCQNRSFAAHVGIYARLIVQHTDAHGTARNLGYLGQQACRCAS